MSTYLRKCLDIAPSAILDPGVFNDYRILRLLPWWPALRATTSHIRILADWPSVQPELGKPVGVGTTERNPPRNAADCLAALDGQIKAATDDGMQVIVMPYRYPRWTNGTSGLVNGSQQDNDFFPQDRVARLTLYQNWREGRTARPAYRDHFYGMPLDGFGPDSEWARYVRWLWDRYVAQAPKYGRAAYFEVVNEPNLQIWPQHSTIETDNVYERFGIEGTSLVVVPAVAEMMVTMDGIAREYGATVPCLAGSTSDTDVEINPRTTTIAHRSKYTTTQQTLVEPLLEELRARGFAGGDHWIWSYHNYSDVERAESHVSYLRQALVAGGWNGRRLDGGPELYCTEGGARLTGLNSATTGRFRLALGRALTPQEQRFYQGQVITESLSRHHYSKGVGAGVGMLTQYLTYSDANFDSGLLDTLGSGGAERPALAAWSAVPEYLAPVAPRTDWAVQL
jgi:hypothetical protein